MGKLETKNPHRPYANGGNPKGGMNKESTMLIHGLTLASPMPRKKPPLTRAVTSEGTLEVGKGE